MPESEPVRYGHFAAAREASSAENTHQQHHSPSTVPSRLPAQPDTTPSAHLHTPDTHTSEYRIALPIFLGLDDLFAARLLDAQRARPATVSPESAKVKPSLSPRSVDQVTQRVPTGALCTLQSALSPTFTLCEEAYELHAAWWQRLDALHLAHSLRGVDCLTSKTVESSFSAPNELGVDRPILPP